MAKLTVEEVIDRSSIAHARRDDIRDDTEACYHFALLDRKLRGERYDSQSRKKHGDVVDSTAAQSTRTLANRIHSGLFTPRTQWCRLKVAESFAGDREQAQKLLDTNNRIMFEVLTFSNFDLAILEFLKQLIVGTGVIWINEGSGDSPIQFETIPPDTVAIEGTDNVYRNHKLRAESIPGTFPEAELDPDLQRIIREDPTQKITLIDATIIDPETQRYYYYLIWPDKKAVMMEKIIKSSPFVVTRFDKNAGDDYGTGPLMLALPAIKTLNKVQHLLLKNAALNVSGVFTAMDDGVVNVDNIRIVPGAVIPVGSNGGPRGATLQPLPRTGDPQLAQFIIGEQQQSVKQILMDDNLPKDNMSARSAFEVDRRTKALVENLGPAVDRLMSEALFPIVKRIIAVLNRKKVINMTLKLDGQEAYIQPDSPIARAANLREVSDTLEYAQVAMAMGPVGQSTINVPRLLAKVARDMNIDLDVLNSEQEQQVMMEQMMQAQQQQQQQGGAGSGQG